MTIVLKSKNEKGYTKIVENVTQIKELGVYIAYAIYSDWSIYKLVLKTEVERIVI